MDRARFFSEIREVITSPEDLELIQFAYFFAKVMHDKERQKRDDGERYFEHPRRTALTVLRHNGTALGIILALLHDIIEDTYIPLPIIRASFKHLGEEVEEGVALLSKKIQTINPATGTIRLAKKSNREYFSGILSASVIILIDKAADRLDNLETFGIWPPKRQEKYIRETKRYFLEIVENIARQTGDEWFKKQLNKFLV